MAKGRGNSSSKHTQNDKNYGGGKGQQLTAAQKKQLEKLTKHADKKVEAKKTSKLVKRVSKELLSKGFCPSSVPRAHQARPLAALAPDPLLILTSLPPMTAQILTMMSRGNAVGYGSSYRQLPPLTRT